MLSCKIIASNPEQPAGRLYERGWSLHSSESSNRNDIIRALIELGERLGTRVPGRAGSLEEVIEPRPAEDAHPRSLSARYGLGTLPYHTELSHRTTPCRYLLLACIDPGATPAATMLLDWQKLRFTREDLELLEEAPILVRTGRRSFYSTILSTSGAFVRYDPGCIEALDQRGRSALRLVESRIADAQPDVHHWHRGDILIIDNWRVLHGRSPSDRGTGRRLARILIDA